MRNWFRSNAPVRRSKIKSSGRAGQLKMEPLEERRLLAVFSIDDVTVDEGGAGDSNEAVFTVTLDEPAGPGGASVEFTTQDVTATENDDYFPTSGILSFAAGETVQTVTVQIIGDTIDEIDETFEVVLSNPSLGNTIGDDTGVGTITDDDDTSNAPTVNIGDATVTEGDNTPTDAIFTVTLSESSGQDVLVTFQTQGGTATPGVDYTPTAGILTFSAGETEQTVTVQVLGDTLDELDETFQVALTSTANATFGDNLGEGTILDNDDPPLGAPEVSISDATVDEGDTGETTNAIFTVTLSASSGQQVLVTYETTGAGSATAGTDYAPTAGVLTFTPGQTQQTVTVQVLGDTLDEIDETFEVQLSAAANATFDDSIGQGTIVDDDDTPAAPTVSIGDATVTEGDVGNTAGAVFTVTLSESSGQPVLVTYQTQDGTATAGPDYVADAGVLTFSAGQTQQTITVLVLGDSIDELDETFQVVLTSTANATIDDATGQGTIIDNDPLPPGAPTATIGDATVTEGDTGDTTNAVFTVTLSHESSGQPVLVTYQTQGTGSATAGLDYAPTAGVLTFTPGQTEQTVTVQVLGDSLDEPDETFEVQLTSAANAALGNNGGDVGEGTITDNDAPPTVSIGDATVTEGDTGNTTAAVFTVTLSESSGQPVIVPYNTQDGTATTTDGDYVTATDAVTFTAGQTQQTITVQVVGDTVDETDETFQVVLTSPTNATIDDGTGEGTIIDDDETPGAPDVSIGDATVTEGDTGTTNAIFTVTLSESSGQPVVVSYNTQDGSATAGTDYTPTAGILTFTAGQTQQTITVQVLGDTLDELDETFQVVLTSTANAEIDDGTGQGTITDDDEPPAGAPTVDIGNATVTEGDVGDTTNAVFTVTLSGTSSSAVTVAFNTQDGSATAGADYTPTAGILTFTAGQTQQTVTVQVLGDTIDELDETFQVVLSAAANATIDDGTGQGTITDDDAPPTGAPTVDIGDATVTEGDGGTTNAIFTVTLSETSSNAVTVAFNTQGGSAAAGVDYNATAGILTFTAGQTQQTITVQVLGDSIDETDETFQVVLSAAANATIDDGTGDGTILDDDEPPVGAPTVNISDATVIEGNTGTTNAVFTVTLSGTSSNVVTVNYQTQNGSATAPADYVSQSGTVTFQPGQTQQTVTIQVQGDTIDEPNETFTVVLSAAAGATVSDSTGVGNIIDDDGVPPTLPGDCPPIDPNAVARDGTEENFIRNLYEDLLNRVPDTGGFDFWMGVIGDNGDDDALRRDIIDSFLGSREYLSNLVRCFYQVFLKRVADQGGLDFWTDKLQEGTREEEIIAGFLTSDEYFFQQGSTNRGFVEGLYRDLLARPGEPGGVDFWTEQLDQGASRRDVVLAFVNSQEMDNRLVREPGGLFFMENWNSDYFEGQLTQDDSEDFVDDLQDDSRWRNEQSDMLALDRYYDDNA